MNDSDQTDAGRFRKAFSSKGWIFEPKIDGARCITYISNNTVELKNRRMRSITYRYPEIIRALKQDAGDCILDGEMAVFSKGVPSFSSLAVQSSKSRELASIIFPGICLPAISFSIYFTWARKV